MPSYESKQKFTERNQDFFCSHFNYNLSKETAVQIEEKEKWTYLFENWPALGRLKKEWPNIEPTHSKPKKPKLLLDDDAEDIEPVIGEIPDHPFSATNIEEKSFVKPQILNNYRIQSFTALQREIFTILCHYNDFYFPYSYYDRWDKLRPLYLIHILNHVLKTSKQITNHNSKIKNNPDTTSRVYDQGITRPKVLILLPFKNSAYKVIKLIASLLNYEVKNLKRFEADYSPSEADEIKNRNLKKPEDFVQIFEGDVKEDFKIGLTVTKKSLKLYSDFFESDIVIASPLGLRYCLDSAKTSQEKEFLSSIEICIMDQADIFLMQNWEHILIIMEALNKFPENLQDLNFDLHRTRRWCIEGRSHYYRQTVIFSSLNADLLRAVISRTKNFAGRVQALNLSTNGTLNQITVQAELTLEKVKTDSEIYDFQAHFNHFTKNILPRLSEKNHVMIFVPDYCDYVKLVHYFKEDGGASVATVNEYMVGENSKVAKARCLFFEGKRKFLIYTERFHFYRRYQIKGIQHIVFYGLPIYPHFFSEISNFMSEEYQNPKSDPPVGLNSILVPFQNCDAAKLIQILGTSKASEILKADKKIHVCLTND